tara:strand:+ start:9609 stop:10070 length:462 start_codon:yes stop_codon:yes gene_type:complete
MKWITLIIIFSLLGCSRSEEKKTSDHIPNLNWLPGDWIRTNGDLGENTYESWLKTEYGYSGKALTIVNGDTVFTESIKAYLEDNQWHYEVSGPNEEPVTFTSTAITDSSFICENPAHDFPKEISYSKDGDCVNATISDGEDKQVLFRYERRVK